MQAPFDPARHEPLTIENWNPDLARQSIERICRAAEAEFDDAQGCWLVHPDDDPPQQGATILNLYFGATGVAWASSTPVWCCRRLPCRGC
jgi:hypothetical protein